MSPHNLRYYEAVRELASAQKSNRGAPIYSRLVNRPWGRLLAAAAYRLDMTPDQVTVVSALCTYAGIALVALAPPSVPLGLLVGFLLMLGYALDSADGQLARLRGGGTPAGEWLDHIADAIKLATIHGAVAISVFRFGGRTHDLPDWVLLIPLAFGAIQYVQFFTFILTDKMLRADDEHRLAAQDTSRPSVLKSILAAPHDYGLLCLSFLLLGFPPVFLTLYTLLMLGSGVYLAGVLIRSHRRVSALGAGERRPPKPTSG